jgi:hypothetical protein
METFLVSEKEKSVINALQNVSEKAIETKINILKKWIEQCPHLPLESKGNLSLKTGVNHFFSSLNLCR